MTAAAAQAQDYAVKPQWWDTVKVTVSKEKTPEDSYKASVDKNKAADNVRADIRIITEIIKGIPADNQKSLSTFTGKIINGYKSLGDYANMYFWVDNQLKSKIDSYLLKKMLEDYYKTFSDNNKAAGETKSFFRRIFMSDKFDTQIRALAVTYMLELMLKRNEPSEVLKFLADNNDQLKEIISYDRLMFEIRGLIQKGDHENASKSIKLYEDIPELKGRKDFLSLKKTVVGTKTGAVQVDMDWEYDSVVEKANKCESENSSAKLINLIRATLLAKANSLTETGDGSMLRGAAAKYKETFSKYEKMYAPSVDVYINLLKDKSEYSQAQIAKRKNLLTLSGTSQKFEVPPVLKYSSSEINIPDSSKFIFQPIFNINPGTFEYMEQSSQYSLNRLASLPPVSFNTYQNLIFAQNSRQMIAVKDGACAWNTMVENSTPEIATPSAKGGIRSDLLTGYFNPASNGKMTFPRMLVDGKFTLQAIENATGRTVWTFKSQDCTLCSDATPYAGQLIVLAKKIDAIPRYYLLFINQENGALEDEMFLFSGDETMGVFKDTVLCDFLMPPPAVDNQGKAFITTNFGIVYCVDVAGNYILWAKKYPRLPFALSKDVTNILLKRRLAGAVPGRQNVLFAPIDSSALLLMNKDTGRIVMEKNINWSDVRRAGPDSALIIDDMQKAAIYSLEGLISTASLPGQGYCYVDSLKDGFVLAESSGAELWSDSGKLLKKIPLPQNFILKAISKTSCIGFQKGAAINAAGTLVPPSSEKKSAIPFQATEKNISALDNPSIRNFQGKYYVFTSNYIIKLSDKAEPEWAFPVKLDRNTSVVHLAKTVALSTSSYIYELSSNDGSLLRCYPDPGTEPVDISAPAISKGKILFVAEPKSTGKTFLMQMDESGVKTLNPLPWNPNVLAIFDNGKTLITIEDRNIVQFKANADSVYSKTGNTIKMSAQFNDHHVSRIDSERIALVHPYYCILVESSGITRIDSSPQAGGAHFWQWKSTPLKIYGNFITAKLHADYWTIFDLEKKSAVSKAIKFTSEPFIAGKLITSFSKTKAKGNAFTATCIDIKSEKELYQEPVDLGKVFPQNSNARRDMSFTMDGSAYHVFSMSKNAWETSESDENAVVIQNLSKKQFDVKAFPGYRQCYDALALGGNILFLFDNGLKLFSKDEFLKLSDKLSTFYTAKLNSSAACSFDGYPDEWDLQKFFPAGKNMFYSFYTKTEKNGNVDPSADFVFAGILKDEKLLEKIGARGLDDRITFTFIPGSLACFRTDNFQAAGFTANCGDKSGTKFKFNYSMSPSGDFCFFEMLIPVKNIFHFNLGSLTKLKNRNNRGDLAFYFQLRNPDGTEESFFSKTERFPLYYPRLNFSSDKDSPSKP
ncbi:MAG TPA: hypothetical protein DET40_12435 [Lentisphaeria bacterium]|nr:MAG: hypothetical protein A2X45_00420 [Lentisphaerae bacterium GWF2_50_93]HCE44346.1 hypothetical protein [Lentisphaeria bacterium]